MADSVSDIRRRTQAIIEENERKHRAEIRALESDYRRRMEELRTQSEKQQAECRRNLAELDKKINAALAAGQREVAEQTRRLAAEQRRKLNEIEANAAAALERCSKELRAEIDRRYRIVEEEIRRLYEAIASQDEKERLCAELALRKAEEAFRQVQASEAVQEFNQSMLPPLQDVYKRLAGLCDQQIWAALGSTALALELDCVVTMLEADEKLQAWTTRNTALLQRLQLLQSQLLSTNAEAWHFHHWLLDYTCALHPWNEEAFATVEQQLAALAAELNARGPRCTMSRMAEMGLEIGQEKFLLDAAMDCAQRHVGSFLSLAQLLAGLTEEIPMANTAWELAEDAQMEPVANVGTMAFRRTGGSIGNLQVTVREHPTHGSGLLLTLLYDGTRSRAEREHELRTMCTRLATALSDTRYGGIVLGNAAPFTDGSLVGLNIPVGEMHVPQGTWTGADPLGSPDPDPAADPRTTTGGTAGGSPVS